ncbi:MAG TPA: YicC family protein [Clostridiaceae bacterium]|nr:YicC family protein [Clostridiaceae bacterium]
MIRSMTGFGRGEYENGGRKYVVEIKTVNHRYADIFVKVPRQISFIEDRVRQTVSKNLSRGKIDVFVNYESNEENSKLVLIDEVLAESYINAVRFLRDNFGLQDDISTSLISRFPDVLKVEKAEEDVDEIWEGLKIALDEAISCVIKMRENEGEGLKKDFLKKAAYVESLVEEISKRAPEVVKDYKQRLETRIKELLEQQTIDESRLAMEVAIFADRCSIDEELVRIKSHINQLREILDMDQPIGRKLDFLIQEMNREINTIGSKANDLIITKNVIEIKSEIEKIREQIQNVE